MNIFNIQHEYIFNVNILNLTFLIIFVRDYEWELQYSNDGYNIRWIPAHLRGY